MIRATSLSLMLISILVASAQAAEPQVITACAGKDSKGNSLHILVKQDTSAKEFSSSNPSSITIDVTTDTQTLSYLVYDTDSELSDASLSAKSEDNGGIHLLTNGGGVATSGAIGQLGSTFSFVDCQAGPAAPMPW